MLPLARTHHYRDRRSLKVDEMVRQSPERAYDIAFFDEFARAAGWTARLSLENPEFRTPS